MGFGACKLHLGSTVQGNKIAAREQVEFEVSQFAADAGLDVDPDTVSGEQLMLLAGGVTRRRQEYLAQIQAQVAEAAVAKAAEEGKPEWFGHVKAIAGDAYGESGKTGEYLRVVAAQEGVERDRMARIGKAIHDAGIAQQRLAMDAEVASAVAEAVRAGLRAVGLENDVVAVEAAQSHLRLVG